jgi:hypothetical protein
MVEVRLPAWRVHDTGLVTAPGRFRRLGGAVRHHRGQGEPWPEQVEVVLEAEDLVVRTPAGTVVGTWPRAHVRVQRLAAGPPVTFVVEVPEEAHLLAAAAGPDLTALFDALATT